MTEFVKYGIIIDINHKVQIHNFYIHITLYKVLLIHIEI